MANVKSKLGRVLQNQISFRFLCIALVCHTFLRFLANIQAEEPRPAATPHRVNVVAGDAVGLEIERTPDTPHKRPALAFENRLRVEFVASAACCLMKREPVCRTGRPVCGRSADNKDNIRPHSNHK